MLPPPLPIISIVSNTKKLKNEKKTKSFPLNKKTTIDRNMRQQQQQQITLEQQVQERKNNIKFD